MLILRHSEMSSQRVPTLRANPEVGEVDGLARALKIIVGAMPGNNLGTRRNVQWQCCDGELRHLDVILICAAPY